MLIIPFNNNIEMFHICDKFIRIIEDPTSYLEIFDDPKFQEDYCNERLNS